ncbi:MAG: hypothetical protein NVSMB5_23350 [Candidatus Velthaea sp.]
MRASRCTNPCFAAARWSARHDFNEGGAGGPIGNGNSLNIAFNIPRMQYLHGYLEMNSGATSALTGTSGGPTWKGMLWLTIPITNVK